MEEFLRIFIPLVFATVLGFVIGVLSPFHITIGRVSTRLTMPDPIALWKETLLERSKQARERGDHDLANVMEKLAKGEDPKKVIDSMPKNMRDDFNDFLEGEDEDDAKRN